MLPCKLAPIVYLLAWLTVIVIISRLYNVTISTMLNIAWTININ